MPATRVIKNDVKQSDAWDGGVFTLLKDSFDWTDCEVKMQWRQKPGGTVFLTQTPSLSFPALGEAQFSVSLTGAETSAFPEGIILADVQVSRTSPLFGPYTIGQLQINVESDITI